MSNDSLKYFRVAWQSALAAASFLGLPAGLLLWLILLRGSHPTSVADPIIEFLQVNGLNKIYLLAFCSLGWSFSLGRICGYRPAWHIGLATLIGILLGWFSPLSNMDGWLSDKYPIPTLYTFFMCGLILSITSTVGLMYGLLLRSIKAALAIALSTSLVSVLTVLLTILLFDQLGIRVGGDVPFAMSKVTVMGLLLSAVTAGAMLGVGFSWFVERNKVQ